MVPLVSIVMPVWNREKYIVEALRSCQAQSGVNIEICVADDASDDGTLRAVKEVAELDGRIKYVQTNRHLGYAGAFNRAVLLSDPRSDYIARMESDDLQEPWRLFYQIERLEQEPHVNIVTCGFRWIDPDGRWLDHSGSSKGFDRETFLVGRHFGPCWATYVCRRSLYDSMGLLEESAKDAAPVRWVLKCIEGGLRWAHIDDDLYYYRRHPDQQTARYGLELHRDYVETVRVWREKHKSTAWVPD